MRPLFETIFDLDAAAEIVRERHHGIVETVDGRFHSLRFRPFPKLATFVDVAWVGRWHHHRAMGNRCLLYYNQPLRQPRFLALKYVVSTRDCTLSTFHAALKVLDEIARLKESDAIVTDAANDRISQRLLARWGWAAHCPNSWHRNFIKRFYGDYPPPLASGC